MLLAITGVINFAAPAHAAVRYVMTAFTNASQSNMNVYESADAINFSLMRQNAYTPPSGLIRDPSIMRHTDGYYYIVYTTGWNGDTIGIARSSDQVNWTFQRNVTVGLNGATGSTWAPEWFKDSDGSVNVVVSLSSAGTNGPFTPYKITATNSALSTWSARTAIGIPANHIDTFVLKSGTTYHAFVKNETTKYIEHATASSLTGPWNFVGTGDWAGWGGGAEGPAVVQLSTGAWRIYFDSYSLNRYFYADSNDLNNWSAKVELPGVSGTVRHFTVIRDDTTSGPSQLFSDDFEDGNADGWVTNGGTWQVVQPAGSSREYQKSSTGDNLSTTGSSAWGNYYVQGYVNIPDTNGGICLLGRVQSNSQYYQLELKKDAAGVLKWWIWANNNGTWTEVASGPYSYAANSHYLLRLTMNGSTLTASVSSNYGSSFQTLGSGTNSAFATGKIGVRSWGSAGRFDVVQAVSL